MMFGTRARNACGFIVLVLTIGMFAPPAVYASTEPDHQCFQMSPYSDTVRFMRLSTDYTPGMVGLFVRWRGTSFQMLGSGLRTASMTAGLKDIVFTAVRADTGALWRWSGQWNPTTATGTWTIYGDAGFTNNGTLTPIACTTSQFAGQSFADERPVHAGLSATPE